MCQISGISDNIRVIKILFAHLWTWNMLDNSGYFENSYPLQPTGRRIIAEANLGM